MAPNLNVNESDDILSCMTFLHSTNDWRTILEIPSSINKSSVAYIKNGQNQFELSSLLWSWPSEKALHWLGEVPKKYGAPNGITSIGCGSGLLEWLIEISTGTKVISIDLIDSWWSKCTRAPNFSSNNDSRIWVDPKTFIDYKKILSPETALLFCYFNNEIAFSEYLKAYTGHVLVIIGPKPNLGRHTAPMPLEIDLIEKCGSMRPWKLEEVYDFNDYGDVAAVWTC